jgi:Amt family ammonium transporter
MTPSFDLIWLIFCAILVSTMQAGFCSLESGLVRAKNSINVAIKNLVDFCIAGFMFSLFGFNLMFGESIGGLMGTHFPPMSTWTGINYAYFLFQITFCGTATTIVSGAVAERMSFLGYFIAAVILSSLIYPITGHWVWGGQLFGTSSGWLKQLQFHDFAGATVVHSVGGWMALAAILIIGPRLGRFKPRPRIIEGHNLPTAVLGVFLLWFGWFGFNGGNTLTFNDQVPRILVNTLQGGAAGGLTACLTTGLINDRPQVPLIMNGVIGGLVSITAGCSLMDPLASICVGGIGGILCTFSTRLLSYYRLDDPIGVIPAHLICGIWGTLAVALFSDPNLWASNYNIWQKLGVQLLGVSAIGGYAFSISYISLLLVNRIYPLRVTAEQEHIGLNISEHGASTATQELITSMNFHSLKGDFTQPVFVEPETDVAPIAHYYNLVLDKMNRSKAEVEASQQRLLAILNSPAFPVVISDSEEGIMRFINERAAELFGFTLQESGRYREKDFWYNLSDRAAFLEKVRSGNYVASFEAQMRQVDGTVFWSLISGLEITEDNQPCILFSFSDISTQIKRENSVRYLASTDPLTGIYNRRTFIDKGSALIAQLQFQTWPMSVLMLDIDYFKQINDRFGHGIGDLVIQQFAKTCASLLRKEDLFGRIGGEEFAVLLSNTSLDTAEMIGEKLRQGIAQTPIPTESDLIQITTSVGVAAIHLNDTVENALTRADIALYQAKANGRDRVESHHG